MRLRVRIAAVAVLSVLTAGPVIGQDGFAVSNEEQCVGHEFNLPGQGFHLSGSGFHLSGSAGGMVRGEITFTDGRMEEPNTTVEPVSLAGIAKKYEDQLTGASMVRDAVIIVADDFAGDNFLLPSALTGPGVDDVALADLVPLVESGEFSHGALVMHHLNALVAATGAFSWEETIGGVTYWRATGSGSGGHQLVIAPLDMTADEDSQEITIADVLQSLGRKLQATTDGLEVGSEVSPVVNMSWVFLPCSDIDGFLSHRGEYENFETYVRAVHGGESAPVIEEFLMAEGNVLHADLVRALDDGEFGVLDLSRSHSFVAASGNFSMDYQMLPAGWRHVVGAAVRPPTGRTFPGRYSNIGDVTVAGEWFTFQPLIKGALEPETQLHYAGTSFAAPLVSLYLALDAASQDPACLHVLSDRPPLAPGGDDPRDLGPLASLDLGDGADAPLKDAISNCGVTAP